MSFGRRLYDTVFRGEMREGLSRMLSDARNQSAELRIRLLMDEAPKLAQLPWEYIYRSESRPPHMVLDNQTPIVRFFPTVGAAPVPLVEPPLNILVMLANPSAYPELMVEAEWNRVRNALEPLIVTNQVTLDRLPNGQYPHATQTALMDQLSFANKQYHVFHFIGHGGYDNEDNAGLAFDGGPNGDGEIVSAEGLLVALSHFTLRMVILNACDTARLSRWNAFSGVAQSLVEAQIPAVIAMQFKITDSAAIAFAEGFYKAMAAGHPVENSLNIARRRMYLADNPTEWGTPVLFTQSEDGIIFQIDALSEEQIRQARVEALAGDARAAIDEENWDLAIESLQTIIDL